MFSYMRLPEPRTYRTYRENRVIFDHGKSHAEMHADMISVLVFFHFYIDIRMRHMLTLFSSWR